MSDGRRARNREKHGHRSLLAARMALGAARRSNSKMHNRYFYPVCAQKPSSARGCSVRCGVLRAALRADLDKLGRYAFFKVRDKRGVTCMWPRIRLDLGAWRRAAACMSIRPSQSRLFPRSYDHLQHAWKMHIDPICLDSPCCPSTPIPTDASCCSFGEFCSKSARVRRRCVSLTS